MKPKIDKTKFGSITIAGEKYEYDVLIRLDGKIKKRKKKLSREVYGTSHILSLTEAEHIYEDGAENIIIGTGQSGMLKLSDEASEFFRQRECRTIPRLHRRRSEDCDPFPRLPQPRRRLSGLAPHSVRQGS